MVKDIKVIDQIKPDATAISQTSAIIQALDLMGYLTHPQELKVINLSFSHFLNNEVYFPSINQHKNHINFLNLLRDDVISIMAHRFSLTMFDITEKVISLLF